MEQELLKTLRSILLSATQKSHIDVALNHILAFLETSPGEFVIQSSEIIIIQHPLRPKIGDVAPLFYQ